MKTSHYLILGILIAVTAFIAFRAPSHGNGDVLASASASPSHTGDPWPQLLLRNDVLAGAPEWEATVAAVNQASSDLIEDPNNAKALIKLAKIYTNEARVTGEHGYYYPAILAMLDRALACDEVSENDQFEAYGLRANTLMSQHHFVEALAAAEFAVGLNPQVPSAYAALIDAHVEMGNYGAAVRHAQALMDMRPDLVSYARASYLRELHGDIDGAIEAMQMAVTAGYPGRENTEWARITLAEMLVRYDRLDEAEQQYLESLHWRDRYPFALAGLAQVRMAQERYDEAEELFNQAIAIIPEFGFQEGLLELYQKTGRATEAQEALKTLIAMLDDDIAHGHSMNLEYSSILLKHAAQPEEALAYAMTEYRQRPANIDVNYHLAEIYSVMGEGAKAREHLDVAMRTGSADPAFRSLASRLATM